MEEIIRTWKHMPDDSLLVAFVNNGRRSGRSSILIAQAITRLLCNGECLYIDDHTTNPTHTYYKRHIQSLIRETLSTLLRVSPHKIDNEFVFKYRLDSKYCYGIEVYALNKGQFQY